MIRKTKALEKIEERMEELDPNSLRYEVLACAKQFKIYWIELGRFLYAVWKDKNYKEWGYTSFETYCAKEIGIKHSTASKLLKSYYFLEREEPGFLRKQYVEERKPSDLPSFEAVNLLRLAKANKNINETDYKALREKALEKGQDVSSVRREFRAIVDNSGTEDPEEIYKKRRIANLRRLVTILKQVTKEAEYADILPKAVLNEASRLVNKIEYEISR